MLKVRVIPTLLWKNVGLVKGISFDSWRRVGTIMPAIKVYNTRDVDELIVVDITATNENREPDYDSVEEFSAECFVPLTVGGGIRALEHIRNLLCVGADKVSINSAAYTNPELVSQAANRFGSQCIVASIDAQRMPDGSYECFSHSGTCPAGREPSAWARELERHGAGEILITSIERDGTMQGYDIELIQRVTESVTIPVIASGGAGNYQHMFDAITKAKPSAVAAASIFHFTEQTPLGAKRFLGERNIPVRNINSVQSYMDVGAMLSER
ncbi:MAG: imidazole glycerol phosphate synthase cyclase subunit [Candidatus Omnitrophica bacterium]|nr:imidazole glycerol phosphate synthase cyclase subunit [Candidatus Omnitrophota bacterium]